MKSTEAIYKLASSDAPRESFVCLPGAIGCTHRAALSAIVAGYA